MENIQEKARDLISKFREIEKNLDLPKKKKEIEILEAETLSPTFWGNQQKAQEILKKLGELKKEVSEIELLSEDIKMIEELLNQGALEASFEKDIKRIAKEIKHLEIKTFLSGPYDSKNAIVSIHAGQGGVEAMDWVSMLYRMYLRFCERRGWETKTIDISYGEEAGIKSVTFLVQGASYGYLKNEAGVHRLVRNSPFNADNLRQTSFALVEVLPEFEEVDIPDIEIKEEDLEWQFFRSSTQGGQNVQKVSTAVRVIHKLTGISATSQQERSQEQNRKIALNLLRARLWALEEEKKEKEKKELKGEYKPASWGNQIRSYVLQPYQLIKDLRTGFETSDAEKVLDGEIDGFIEAELVSLAKKG